jgi:hypothetical protein
MGLRVELLLARGRFCISAWARLRSPPTGPLPRMGCVIVGRVTRVGRARAHAAPGWAVWLGRAEEFSFPFLVI